jgi:oxygen-independent coproporphyrinogen III oxidase
VSGIIPIGLYIHIPFCAGKCPYCDFYSVCAGEDTMDRYAGAVMKITQVWGEKLGRSFDTLYFGGGTPSILGAERLSILVDEALRAFNNETSSGMEITVECNPSDVGAPGMLFDFEKLVKAGVNRISLGLQSAVNTERAALGRRGVAADTPRAIEKAKAAGITNISLDLMLGIPGQTTESLRRSIDFCTGAGITHVSAYILKIEEATPFAEQKARLNLPDEDAVCDFYLQAVEELEQAGFMQYEISNFALKGYESRHNLKYWNCDEYLGIGPAAHSFIDGKRFFYPRDLNSFISGCEPVQDSGGGSFEEYAMLRLRLNEGLPEHGTIERYGFGIPNSIREKAKFYENNGLLFSDVKGIRFTSTGFLLSSKIIGELLDGG